jgi:hypothetical protein
MVTYTRRVTDERERWDNGAAAFSPGIRDKMRRDRKLRGDAGYCVWLKLLYHCLLVRGNIVEL